MSHDDDKLAFLLMACLSTAVVFFIAGLAAGAQSCG